jgi:hypothetical protein
MHNKNKPYSLGLPLLLFSFAFFGYISAQIQTGTRLEFNLEASHYFTEELNMPSLPATSLVVKKSEVKIQAISGDAGSWSLLFEFPEPLTFHQEIQGNNLYLEFNQNIDSKDLIKVQEKIGTLIKRFANGYNTLYLVGKQSIHYHLEQDGQKFILTMIPDDNAPIELTRQAKIAFARLLVEKRYYWGAMEAIHDLKEEYPYDKDVFVLDATLEGLLPRWQHQVGILKDLHAIYPLDEDIETLMYEAFTPHSSFIKGQRQMQRTIGLAAVQVYLLEAEVIANATPYNVLYAGSQYQLWDGHVLGIVNSQGAAVGFRGWRNRVSLFMRNEWSDGSFLKGSLYDQKAAFGMGLEYGQLYPVFQGYIRTELQWHRPTWEIFECLAFNGREDRFYSSIDSVYNRYINWSIGGGARRVGISGTADGFVSALANANIFLNLLIPNPIIGINYSLDAEYVKSRTSKIGIDGLPFFPVPYTSFENHTLKAYLIYIFGERWYISAYGGETFNRLGLDDKTYGASVSYIKPVPCGWEARLSFDSFPSTIVSGATAEYLTASLMYRF